MSFFILQSKSKERRDTLGLKKKKKVQTELNDSPHFKKPLQVVNLSQGHGHQHQSLEERPEHHATVCVVVYCGDKRKKVLKPWRASCSSLLTKTEDLTCSVYPLTDLHVLLLVFDRRHGHRQLVNHLLQLVLVCCNGTGSDENMLECNSWHAWPSREQRGNHIHMEGVKCRCFFTDQRYTLYWLVSV